MSSKREQKYEFFCHNCRNKFRASRNDAKYCSQKCRRDVMKRRQSMHDFYTQFLGYLENLEKTVYHPDLGSDAFNLIERIESRVCKVQRRVSKTDLAYRLAMDA